MDAKLGRNNKRNVRRAMAQQKNNESKKNGTITKEQQMNETSQHQHKKMKRDQNERVAKSTAATVRQQWRPASSALAFNVICTFHIYTKYTCVACRFSLPFTVVTIEFEFDDDFPRHVVSSVSGSVWRIGRQADGQTEWLAAWQWQTVGTSSGTSKQQHQFHTLTHNMRFIDWK